MRYWVACVFIGWNFVVGWFSWSFLSHPFTFMPFGLFELFQVLQNFDSFDPELFEGQKDQLFPILHFLVHFFEFLSVVRNHLKRSQVQINFLKCGLDGVSLANRAWGHMAVDRQNQAVKSFWNLSFGRVKLGRLIFIMRSVKIGVILMILSKIVLLVSRWMVIWRCVIISVAFWLLFQNIFIHHTLFILISAIQIAISLLFYFDIGHIVYIMLQPLLKDTASLIASVFLIKISAWP